MSCFPDAADLKTWYARSVLAASYPVQSVAGLPSGSGHAHSNYLFVTCRAWWKKKLLKHFLPIGTLLWLCCGIRTVMWFGVHTTNLLQTAQFSTAAQATLTYTSPHARRIRCLSHNRPQLAMAGRHHLILEGKAPFDVTVLPPLPTTRRD